MSVSFFVIIIIGNIIIIIVIVLIRVLSLVVNDAQRMVVLSCSPVLWPEKVSSPQTAHQSAGLNADTFQAINIGSLVQG